MEGLQGMSRYIAAVLNPLTDNREGVEFTARAAVNDAAIDGVTRLEISIGSRFVRYFAGGLPAFTAFVRRLVANAPARIEVSPELGVIRQDVLNLDELATIRAEIDSGVFHGIDLYGAEEGCTAEQAQDLFAEVRTMALRAKAHVGEFGTDAEAVRRTVETLALDAVQHGIAAASSPEVMRWLSDHGTTLNVCPAAMWRWERSNT
jgi:adenosine deaminase